MKKYLLIISIIVLGCKPGKSQTNNIKNMEKFNIEEFRNRELKINQMYKESKNDSVIEVTELKDAFTQYTNEVNSPFQNRKVYYKTSLSLKAEANYFYMIPIGITKKYDENGNVIGEKNWDEFEGRTFSIQQLIDKMRNDFNIDLTDVNRCGLRTAFDPRYGYYYDVIIRNFDSHDSRPREIHINVKTGEVMSDKFVTLKK